ncbi:MAG TPA: ABC transporter permease [Bryobacteraceae bacterium]|nr:ABC transporter permease [Bryobacteraceae bacterium]
MLKEIRQALRLLVKNPGFAVVAALSLALGIGANSAIFSFADALLLRPLPVADPSGVFTVTTRVPGEQFGGAASFPDYRDLRDKNQSFSSLAAFRLYTFGFAPSASVAPQMRMGLLVSDNFFRTAGVQPIVGRAFLPDEGKIPGRDAVAILSYEFWRTEFSSDPGAIGRTIRLNGIDFNVIGVTPGDFTGMHTVLRPALYVPLSMTQKLSAAPKDPLEDRASRPLEIKGRLKPGVTQAQAQAEMAGIGQNLEHAYQNTNRNRKVAVHTEIQARVEQDPYDAKLAAMLSVLVGLVLLIACANVANLVLARSRARSREIAIRLAIGAGRGRLVRQLMIESLVLAFVGAVLGCGLGYFGIRFLRTIPVPTDLPVVLDFQMDTRVMLFSLGVAFVSALIFGLAPALQAGKTDLVSTLKSAGLTSVAKRRTVGRSALVVAQVALSLVLLVAAGMVLDGFRNTLVMSPGFRTDHVMLMELDTSFVRYSDEKSREFYRTVVDRARVVPGVTSVALAEAIPLMPAQRSMSVIPDGYQVPKGESTVTVFGQAVDENYLSTMRVPLLRGRGFTSNDKAGTRRVVVVNQAFAEKFWPNQDPIGKRVRLDKRDGPVLEVVGMTTTGRYLFIGEAPIPYMYVAYAQQPNKGMTVLAETSGNAADLAAPLRNIVHSLDADLPVYNARPLSVVYHQRSVSLLLLILQLVATLGLIGLTLALIGLYGLVAYSASRRTQEIGIRMALGARRMDVLRMVLRQGLILSGIGIAIGLAGSAAVRNLLALGLVGLGIASPAVLVIVPLILIVVTMAACIVPARRASLVDPIRALRYE